MDAGHAIVASTIANMVTGEREPFAFGPGALDRLEATLVALAGRAELAEALFGLARLAAHLKGVGGSATAARALVAVVKARAGEVRALRLRLCGSTEQEALGLERFGRFAETAAALPSIGRRGDRDFRIAFLLEREAARAHPLARAPARRIARASR